VEAIEDNVGETITGTKGQRAKRWEPGAFLDSPAFATRP
jgi:hypothetical protein